MGHEPATLSDPSFFALVRSALVHLYNPDALRRSRLAELLNIAGRFDTPTALQRILIGAVEAAKPRAGTPGFDERSELHDLLTYRYVQQFSQEEVAHQLGISVRHLRRRQNAAIYLVASFLWEKYGLGSDGLRFGDEEEALQIAALAEQEPEPEVGPEEEAGERGNLAWLAGVSRLERTDLQSALPAILEMFTPLARMNNVRVSVESTHGETIAVHPVAFRQVLLHLLSLAVRHSRESLLRVTVNGIGAKISIRIEGESLWQPDSADLEALAVTERVVTLCEGELLLAKTGTPFFAEVAFPSTRPWTVLVIEDNRELVDVIRRFTAGTRFHIQAVKPARDVVMVAEAALPDLVVVDIMMPEIDGLQLLTQLKQSALLAHVPVIVCSVLPQAALATALGAAAFVAKPFRQADLLEALQRAVSAGGLR